MQISQEIRPLLSVLAVLGFVVTGILRQPGPLLSARPPGTTTTHVNGFDDDRVPARLWQDPLAAAYRVARIDLAAARRAEGAAPTAASPKPAAMNLLAKPLARSREILAACPNDACVILPVLVPSISFAQDAEKRLRTRRGLIVSLWHHGYVPMNSQSIGYFLFPQAPPEEGSAGGVADLDEGSHLVIPVEWFKQSNTGQSESKRVAVLWIEENRLREILPDVLAIVGHFVDATERPVGPQAKEATTTGKLQGLDAALQRFERATTVRHEPVDGVFQAMNVADIRDLLVGLCLPKVRAVCIIGPGTSAGLIRLGREQDRREKAGEDFVLNDRVRILSPFATIRTAKIESATDREFGEPRTWIPAEVCGAELLRIPCTDEAVFEAILGELRARRELSPGDELMLITEFDTHYGRDMPYVARESVPVSWFSYLRGLDGEAPNQGDNTKPTEIDEPDGPSQLDSLRRLVDTVVARRLNLQREGRDIGAVGVVGSDEYDKLLILQALRAELPDLVFFTTDLEARYAHHSQRAWTQNLIIGSAFGLQPPADSRLEHAAADAVALDHVDADAAEAATPKNRIWRHVAPFRDSYTTAVYLAGQIALDDFARGLRSDDSTHLDEDRLHVDLGKGPYLFEIGSGGAVLLPEVENSPISPDATPEGSVEPFRQADPSHASQDWARRVVWDGAILALLLGGLAIAYLLVPCFTNRAWPLPRVMREQADTVDPSAPLIVRRSDLMTGLALATTCVLAGVLGLIACASAEPIALFSGISAWPTELIRITTSTLCLVLLIKASRRIWLMQEEVRRKFGRASTVDTETETGYWRMCSLPSRWRRAAVATAVAILAIALVDVCFGLPPAPVRGELAFYTDAVVGWFSRTLAVLLLVFCIDAIRLRIGLISFLQDRTVPFERDAGIASGPFHEKREIDYVAALTREESHVLIYPSLVLVVIAASRHPVIDSWHWNVPLLLVVASGFFILGFYALRLRSFAEALRSRAIEEIDAEVVQMGHAAKEEELTRIDRYREQILRTHTGVFASWAASPIVQGIMIPVGGLGGLKMLETFLQ